MLAGSRFISFLKIFSLLSIVVVLLPSGQARAGIGTVLQDFRIADDVEGFAGPLFAGDEFGYSTAGIGDIDGDGFEDVAIGVPFSDDGRRPDSGGVWILFLEFGGSVRTARKLSDTEGGLSGLLNDFDLFGSSVAAAGDIDGDQIPDLLIGAPGDDDGGTETGSVYLAFLNADGSAREVRKFSNRSNTFLRLLEPGDRFGAAVVGPGDMDGDGIADLIVGAPGDDDGDGADAGAIWILFLDAESEVRRIAKISNKFGELPMKLRSKIGFGSSLASLGRLDTDLTPEIVVGAPFDDTGSGSDVGALFVLWLNSDGTVRESSKISSADGGLGGRLGRGVNFGTSVTPIGDINGDRVVDLLVGAPKDDDGKGDDLGAAWVVMLSRDGTVVARQKISDVEGRLRARLSPGDRFGHGVAALGDVNGDGVVDVLVGAPGDDGSDNNAGAAWVVNLDGIPQVCADANETGTVQGEDALVVLQVVVGLAQCELCRCDTDGDGVISPADALAVIRAAIGLPVTLDCPRCELPESVLARETIR